MHARKAWLDGLSPRENRDIPPLDYDRVYRLKRAWPKLHISINGGIASVEEAAKHLEHVDGVMMGRAAYQEPWRLLQVDPLIYGASAPFESGKAAIEAFIPYVERELAHGTRLHAMTRHVLGLFHGVPGARAFRRHIATHAVKPGAGAQVLREAHRPRDGRARRVGAHRGLTCSRSIPWSELALLAAVIVAGGVVTGILAGLFGIGGGAIIVPVLYEVFRIIGVPEEVRMQLCIGTSLAIIVPTTIRSYQAHRATGIDVGGIIRLWWLPALIGVGDRLGARGVRAARGVQDRVRS